jgi:hypothetical protein
MKNNDHNINNSHKIDKNLDCRYKNYPQNTEGIIDKLQKIKENKIKSINEMNLEQTIFHHLQYLRTITKITRA